MRRKAREEDECSRLVAHCRRVVRLVSVAGSAIPPSVRGAHRPSDRSDRAVDPPSHCAPLEHSSRDSGTLGVIGLHSVPTAGRHTSMARPTPIIFGRALERPMMPEALTPGSCRRVARHADRNVSPARAEKLPGGHSTLVQKLLYACCRGDFSTRIRPLLADVRRPRGAGKAGPKFGPAMSKRVPVRPRLVHSDSWRFQPSVGAPPPDSSGPFARRLQGRQYRCPPRFSQGFVFQRCPCDAGERRLGMPPCRQTVEVAPPTRPQKKHIVHHATTRRASTHACRTRPEEQLAAMAQSSVFAETHAGGASARRSTRNMIRFVGRNNSAD